MTEPTEDEVALARRLFAEWDGGRGMSKSELERRTWGDGSSHGRRFDRFIRQALGESTTRSSKQTDRIGELEAELRKRGHSPPGAALAVGEEDLQHSRRACLAALRIWNDPTAEFRTAGFSLLFVTAWNALAIALLKRGGTEWRRLDPSGNPTLFDGVEQSRDTMALILDALPAPAQRGTCENVRFWVDLRNAVAHRFLPSLDFDVIPHAQAGLLNFERTLIDGFGDNFALAETLSVPLQLSGFRNPDVLRSRKAMQARLPIDVQAILTRAERSTPELLADETFTMRVAFIPVVPASGRSPDAVAYFVRPGEVPTELGESLTEYVVLPKAAHGSRPQLGAKAVVSEVGRHIPFRFNTVDHAEVGRCLGIRAGIGAEDQTFDIAFAEWFPPMKNYLYSQRWIDRLVGELADPARFLELTGRPPVPK